jgi:(R,R)-butanediol dehydrogenase/meso-butanediol dehydrogenase/diacetyl reductase
MARVRWGRKADREIERGLTMLAVGFYAQKGLVVANLPAPAPGADEVLVRVAHAGFCGSDRALMKSGGLPEGYVLGHEVSGVVGEVGSSVRGISTGMRVTVRPSFCGVCRDCRAGRAYFCQRHRRSIGIGDLPGAFAEILRVYPDMLIPVPPGVDSRNAALAEMYAAALHAARVVDPSEDAVLILGGGPVGLALLQILKLLAPRPVVVAEPRAPRRELARRLGADGVIDPTTEAWGPATFGLTAGIGFGTVFECSGIGANLQVALDCLAPGGRVGLVSIVFTPLEIQPLTLSLKEARLFGVYSNTHAENREVLGWMAAGRLDGRALVTDCVPLEALPETYARRIVTGEAVKVLVQAGEAF